MASEGLAGTLTAVLGGQGLRVQDCDSEPSGEPLAPATLRKNVCYVVLAVFLNEQVSVHPLGRSRPGAQPAPAHRADSRPRHRLLERCSPVLQSTLTNTCL